MPPKANQQVSVSEPGKSVKVVPSKASGNVFEGEGTETEIHAQITVPPDGGWGWVVVITSFICVFILDGVVYTFGSVFGDMVSDLQTSDALVALMNSIAMALYFMSSPLISALINRFGFRACIMSGSIICSMSLLTTFFVTNYGALLFFYGVCAGFGYSFINLTSSLIVGFYFEKLRALAMAISSNGSCVGIMVMFPVNAYLVKLAGWRVTTLLHSGFFGLIFFLGMTYRPVLSLTVSTVATDEPTKTVTYLPTVSKASIKSRTSKSETYSASPTEKLFSAVSNVNFPTAAAVVDDKGVTTTSQQPTTSAAVSRFTLTTQGHMSQRQLRQVHSLMSRTSGLSDKNKTSVEIKVPEETQAKRTRFFHWEKHKPESRPMYRDDAFYTGKLENLPEYQKSMMDTTAENRTGFEYQLAVSRAMTVDDIQDRRGLCTTATRRVLATMMDPSLLYKRSFLLLCFSGFTIYIGYLIPYVFIKDRNLSVGIDSFHCTYIVSVIGFTNTVGKLVLGAVACKSNPVTLYVVMCVCSGLGSIMSNFSYDTYYQYFSMSVFGFFISSLACLRSLVIVKLFGLEKLTNGSGIMLLFQGLGSLISTPVASLFKNNFGYDTSFYFAGAFMIFSGLIVIPIEALRKRELKKDLAANEIATAKTTATATAKTAATVTANATAAVPANATAAVIANKTKK